MSGRVWVTHHNGRRTQGYRKNPDIVRRTRTPAHLLPDWEASFELPGLSGLGLATHPGIVGICVRSDGHTEVRGKNKQWVLDQVVALLRLAVPCGLVRPLSIRLRREAEAGPTPSGPLRPREDRIAQIAFDGQRAFLISGGTMRRIGARH